MTTMMHSITSRVALLTKSVLLSCIVLLGTVAAYAQEENTQTPTFKDGVYTKHAELKSNRPGFPLYQLPDFSYRLDREDNLLFLSESTLAQLSGSKIADLDNIWGLCVRGVPYMKVYPSGKASGVVYFVRYHILGSICYLYYPSIEDRAVEMPIYNPYSGERVGGRTVMNRERRLVKQLMSFETGELLPYSVESFKQLAEDDERLIRTIERLSAQEALEKLFKTIKIYNDRHPIESAS